MTTEYCRLCARHDGVLTVSIEQCPKHGLVSSGHLTTLPELKKEFKLKISDIKRKKTIINKQLQFHKDVLKEIDKEG